MEPALNPRPSLTEKPDSCRETACSSSRTLKQARIRVTSAKTVVVLAIIYIYIYYYHYY